MESLLLNRVYYVYSGYSPLSSFLLTFWDILVGDYDPIAKTLG